MSNFNSKNNNRRSWSSVPPIIRQSRSHQVEANSSLSSSFSALSREKRTRDQMNNDDSTQPNNNANTGYKKIKKKDPYYQIRIDESTRRREMIRQSMNKYYIFEVTMQHCREFIQKKDDREGVYCGLLHCTKTHSREQNRITPGFFFMRKDRIKDSACEFLLSWDKFKSGDTRANLLSKSLEKVVVPTEILESLRETVDVYDKDTFQWTSENNSYVMEDHVSPVNANNISTSNSTDNQAKSLDCEKKNNKNTSLNDPANAAIPNIKPTAKVNAPADTDSTKGFNNDIEKSNPNLNDKNTAAQKQLKILM